MLADTAAIVGVGLIGGSLAAALKQRKLVRQVIGVGRNAARLESARQAGLIDKFATEIHDVVNQAEVVVFCTPVDRVADDVRHAAKHWNSSAASSANRQTPLWTDVGSVKHSICSQLDDLSQFVGSHPIAGSHRQGFEAADSLLFEGRTCVVTPTPMTNPSQVARLERFWQAVGMLTVQMTSMEHDRALATTSHLPHLVASALASTLTEENRSLTGTGFRDTTRIAAGDPALWTGILLGNSESILSALQEMQQRLEQFRHALDAKDVMAVMNLLNQGQAARVAIEHLRKIPE